ncbi:MAG: DUF4280 domain-containing protein [Deltaproteobacteria bacterium]|nr:DUF4280 domain-containing protein [Deltaproteobacteria bacterium]
MSQQVVSGASLMCSFGAAPSTLMVPPTNRVMCGNMPAATIMDFLPNTNILPFGMCSAPTNPAVISATAAASGVFTPAPCVPVITGPWTPGSSTVMIGNMPALNNLSTCMCAWLGVISVSFAGQATTMIP